MSGNNTIIKGSVWSPLDCYHSAFCHVRVQANLQGAILQRGALCQILKLLVPPPEALQPPELPAVSLYLYVTRAVMRYCRGTNEFQYCTLQAHLVSGIGRKSNGKRWLCKSVTSFYTSCLWRGLGKQSLSQTKETQNPLPLLRRLKRDILIRNEYH